MFSIDFKPWLGFDLNLANWNKPIIAYNIKLSYDMTDRKKTKTPE